MSSYPNMFPMTTYVKKQKEDIEELASMFKDMLGQQTSTATGMPFMKGVSSRHFTPQHDFAARYSFND